jgi:hypothetical protein
VIARTPANLSGLSQKGCVKVSGGPAKASGVTGDARDVGGAWDMFNRIDPFGMRNLSQSLYGANLALKEEKVTFEDRDGMLKLITRLPAGRH